MWGKQEAVGVKHHDVHIGIGCPSTERSKGVVLAETRRIGRVATVPRHAGIEAEERHGGRCPGWVVVWV
jgi:hypothetical protein